MTSQKLPDFEGMEPNGEYEALPDTFGHLDETEADETAVTPSPFTNEEEWGDGVGYAAPRRLPQQKSDFATTTAQNVLKWVQRTGVPLKLEIAQHPADSSSAVLQEDRELMETLAKAAASSHNQSEAVSLVAALTPLAIRLAPQVYRALWPVLPALVKGMVGLTLTLHRHPPTRPLIQHIPVILEQCVTVLAAHLGSQTLGSKQPPGSKQPLTRGMVARVLARQTELVIQEQVQSVRKKATTSRMKKRTLQQSKRWQNGHNTP